MLSHLVTKNIKKWLSAPDPSTERKAGLDQRSEGTAKWILRDPAFKKWRDWDGNNVLWLHGKCESFVQDEFKRCSSVATTAGTGKSVLWYGVFSVLL
jgi:hypothetical protein